MAEGCPPGDENRSDDPGDPASDLCIAHWRPRLNQCCSCGKNSLGKRRPLASIWSFKELLGMIYPNCRKSEQTGVQWLHGRAGNGFRPGSGSCTMEDNPAIGARVAQSPSINPTATEPVTVLIVEDDELVRELGVEFLSAAGFQVVEASNGEEALSLLESNPDITVLFTDINMP